ncbi:MAG: acyl-CoA synthetase FdrA [Candidatus Tectomicrobia bacterium]
MGTQTRCLILPSTYRDSVVLLQLSHTLENLDGVQQAAVMMGTPQNKTLLRQAALLTTEGEQAGDNDLLICVRADTPTSAQDALHTARQGMAQRWAAEGKANEVAPRTLETALRRMPHANLACISVPGPYARREALQALRHGLHVFLFSDHVDLEAEKELKQLAAQRGLLVMGPDCGTAVLHGVPLGFANQLPRGPVGCIAASGTGLQQVSCLLARQGIGVSQAIGVGGRDLHRELGGPSMRAALQALAGDPDTRVLVLISKPPDAAVAARLSQEARQTGKPCVLAFLGDDGPGDDIAAPLYKASTLEETALIAAALARGEPIPSASPSIPRHLESTLETARAALQPTQRALHALYCGGTLAYEALWLLRRSLGPVDSNLDGTVATSGGIGHVVLDLGAEEFTSGRPHPMIDPVVRRQRLLDIARRPEVAVVLCDVILGWGAHQNPAAALARAWREARGLARTAGRDLIGIATVCGTADDPQGYENQCDMLQEHGFILADSNAQAVRLAVAIVGGQAQAARQSVPPHATSPTLPASEEAATTPEVPAHLPALCADGPRVINLGLELFATQLAASGVPVVHVDWRPPAGGDRRLARLLERLQ